VARGRVTSKDDHPFALIAWLHDVRVFGLILVVAGEKHFSGFFRLVIGYTSRYRERSVLRAHDKYPYE
jgi:hypothetical protein